MHSIAKPSCASATGLVGDDATVFTDGSSKIASHSSAKLNRADKATVQVRESLSSVTTVTAATPSANVTNFDASASSSSSNVTVSSQRSYKRRLPSQEVEDSEAEGDSGDDLITAANDRNHSSGRSAGQGQRTTRGPSSKPCPVLGIGYGANLKPTIGARSQTEQQQQQQQPPNRTSHSQAKTVTELRSQPLPVKSQHRPRSPTAGPSSSLSSSSSSSSKSLSSSTSSSFAKVSGVQAELDRLAHDEAEARSIVNTLKEKHLPLLIGISTKCAELQQRLDEFDDEVDADGQFSLDTIPTRLEAIQAEVNGYINSLNSQSDASAVNIRVRLKRMHDLQRNVLDVERKWLELEADVQKDREAKAAAEAERADALLIHVSEVEGAAEELLSEEHEGDYAYVKDADVDADADADADDDAAAGTDTAAAAADTDAVAATAAAAAAGTDTAADAADTDADNGADAGATVDAAAAAGAAGVDVVTQLPLMKSEAAPVHHSNTTPYSSLTTAPAPPPAVVTAPAAGVADPVKVKSEDELNKIRRQRQYSFSRYERLSDPKKAGCGLYFRLRTRLSKPEDILKQPGAMTPYSLVLRLYFSDADLYDEQFMVRVPDASTKIGSLPNVLNQRFGIEIKPKFCKVRAAQSFGVSCSLSGNAQVELYNKGNSESSRSDPSTHSPLSLLSLSLVLPLPLPPSPTLSYAIQFR